MADPAARTVSPEDLARLKAEREAADLRYNQALGEVDAAVQRLAELPHPPPGPDEQQITPLNQSWEILAARGRPAGWRARVAATVWRIVEPVFQAQKRFNAQVIDHVNRFVRV